MLGLTPYVLLALYSLRSIPISSAFCRIRPTNADLRHIQIVTTGRHLLSSHLLNLRALLHQQLRARREQRTWLAFPFTLKPTQFFEAHVRHLWLVNVSYDGFHAWETNLKLLRTVSCLDSLFIEQPEYSAGDDTLHHSLCHLRLRNLGLSISPSESFILITHLRIRRDRGPSSPPREEWHTWASLAQLPALTHLSFVHSEFVYLANDALAHCRGLCASSSPPRSSIPARPRASPARSRCAMPASCRRA
ncbi:hypothetical protein C8R44DRAFT_892634 [Mycena epipterygia]|nr:hypothetical protein C8R44DRAFT_892634 [Mycena epipterygia]